MMNCPSCYAEIVDTAQTTICRYCDTPIDAKNLQSKGSNEPLRFNTKLPTIDIGGMVDCMMQSYQTQELNWPEFLDKFITHKSFKNLITDHNLKRQEAVVEVKDAVYERLSVDNYKAHLNDSIDTIEDAIRPYFNQDQLNQFDLIAVAGIIRHEIERVINKTEKEQKIQYEDLYPSFRQRVQTLFNDDVTRHVMNHWRHCSAIIHHDDTDELLYQNNDVKYKALKDAYQFIIQYN